MEQEPRKGRPGPPTSPIVSDFNARVYEEHEKRGGGWLALPVAYLAAIRRSSFLSRGDRTDHKV
jgi:hypothetical protein